MPLYRTGPDLSLDDLIASLESKGETIIQVLHQTELNGFTVITAKMNRWTSTIGFGQTETRSGGAS